MQPKRTENMNYSPKRDIPDFARELTTVSPSAICTLILNRRNEKRTPESVTMWFDDHPDVRASLTKEFIQAAPTEKQAADQGLFENGTFRESVSIQNWIRIMTNRNRKQNTIQSRVNSIKRICQGLVGKEGEVIENWSLKHPDRLTTKNCMDYIFELKKRGLQSRTYRLSSRAFMKSKGTVVSDEEINGDEEHNAGQYADLNISREKIYAIFDRLKVLNYEAYLASKFAYKTASRLNATLMADSQYMNYERMEIKVFEKAVNGKEKKEPIKVIPCDLWEEIKDRKGKLFNIEALELNKILRQVYKEIIPEVEQRIPMPFHFWRHLFAQHMLEATGYNYAFVAEIGNWDAKTLQKYYGKMPREIVRKYAFQTVPQI